MSYIWLTGFAVGIRKEDIPAVGTPYLPTALIVVEGGAIL